MFLEENFAALTYKYPAENNLYFEYDLPMNKDS